MFTTGRVASSALVFWFCALLCVFDIGRCDNRENSSTFRWGWTCNNGLCERTSEPVDFELLEFASTYSKTLSICRLTCGDNGPLWPKPSVQSCLSKTTLPFHISKLKFHPITESGDIANFLKANQLIFLDKIQSKCCACNVKSDNSVVISLNTHATNATLLPHVEECYTVNITYVADRKKGTVVNVNITSPSVFGLRHGLETLTQLIAPNATDRNECKKHGSFHILRRAFISDRPAYHHRGLLIDTARNYLSVDTIKRQIEAMSMSKMNVLHWHATDSQSFPVVFPSVPQLAKYGAYSEEMVYTFDDIKQLVEYAKLRGVRIIFELDAPSHAGNGWQFGSHAGLGDLAVCVNRQPWRQYCIQPPCGQLNPVNANLYGILGKLYKDIASVFTRGELFHMGGDELFVDCWNSTEEILDYLTAKGMGRTMGDFLYLWSQYQQKAFETFTSATKAMSPKIIVWSSTLTEPEVITKYLNRSNYIIQTWVPKDDPTPYRLIAKGYELIISTKDAWYLDHGFWGTTTYYTWRTVFENRILKDTNVLGGEVCMWGEYVDDNSIDAKVWPRAAAAAERLWTNSETDTSKTVEPRFYLHRQRLVEAGIRADALTPAWCVQNEGSCV